MDPYSELGVRRVINGNATLTMLGGSLMPTVVLDAMREAARSFVDIDELQEKAGARIAEWTRNEAAYVSCGAAAGLVLSTAACIAGMDEEKRSRLPESQGMKNEIIIHKRGRVGYDFAIRQAGGRLVEIGDESGAGADQLEAAITPRTAAIFVFYKNLMMDGQVALEEQIAIAKRHAIPLVVDAAAQLPPVENLWAFTHMGADLVLFSGGKGLCGPQSSGLILGRRDLIQACAFHACPRPFIGRPMKAGKEEIVGLMTAVRWYLDLDHTDLLRGYETQVAWVLEAFAGVSGVRAQRSFPNEAGQPMPRAEILLESSTPLRERDQLLERLMAGDPAISLAASGTNGVFINPQTLQAGEEKLIVARIKEILGV
jgi:L-seryl-tRNA(Ser) seleniumtransferase